MSAFMGPYKVKEYINSRTASILFQECECGKKYTSSWSLIMHLKHDHNVPVNIAHMCWENREVVDLKWLRE